MKASLPSDPLPRGAVLVALLALSGVYFVYTYLHQPRQERADALRLRIDELETLKQQLGADSPPGISEPERRLETYAAHLARLETLIPASEEVGDLLEAIDVEERRTGVEITMLRPEPREPGEVYDRWSYDVVARGGYHHIASFMTAIASLDRIMVTTDVSIGTETDPYGNRVAANAVLAARFRIRTYVNRGPETLEAPIPPIPNGSIQP